LAAVFFSSVNNPAWCNYARRVSLVETSDASDNFCDDAIQVFYVKENSCTQEMYGFRIDVSTFGKQLTIAANDCASNVVTTTK
jgi:hypothetical protein